MKRKIDVLDWKTEDKTSLEWEEDKIVFWFGYNEIYDTKEKRNTLNRIKKANSLGLGSNTYNVESKLRKHKRELKWEEPERRGMKSKNMRYKKFDIANGYEEGLQWRVRMKINSEGNINFWFEI